MTAFARETAQGEWGSAVWELRSVNHRYLEIGTRLPEDLRALEPAVRECVASYLKRGKVDCNLRYEYGGERQQALTLNVELVQRLANAMRELSMLMPNPAPVDPFGVLRWPGVIEPPDPEVLAEPLIELLERALQALVSVRQREGQKLGEQVTKRCAAVAEHVARLRTQLPEIMTLLRARVVNRVKEVQEEFDEGRLEQELVLLAQRMDVAEEVDRLDAHVEEALRVLNDPHPIGRRLDFLMQEMNREANTLASKSAHIDSTNVSVELKVLIEQMREQIQNIE